MGGLDANGSVDAAQIGNSDTLDPPDAYTFNGQASDTAEAWQTALDQARSGDTTSASGDAVEAQTPFFLFDEPPVWMRPPTEGEGPSATPPEEVQPPLPEYPTDPARPPGPGYEWRGPDSPGVPRGAWFNPQTGETLKPDLGHGDPVGPHWDYIAPGRGQQYRWFPDGRMDPKVGAGGRMA